MERYLLQDLKSTSGREIGKEDPQRHVSIDLNRWLKGKKINNQYFPSRAWSSGKHEALRQMTVRKGCEADHHRPRRQIDKPPQNKMERMKEFACFFSLPSDACISSAGVFSWNIRRTAALDIPPLDSPQHTRSAHTHTHLRNKQKTSQTNIQ